jgi:hypothetical protein
MTNIAYPESLAQYEIRNTQYIETPRNPKEPNFLRKHIGGKIAVGSASKRPFTNSI